jgi:hypothetical protein
MTQQPIPCENPGVLVDHYHLDDGLVRRPGFWQHGRPWHGDAKHEPFAGVDSNSIG